MPPSRHPVPHPRDHPGGRPLDLLLDLLTVFGGGVVGTGLRVAVAQAVPAQPGRPNWVATMTVNIVGAFLLGLLIGWVEARDMRHRRRLTLFLGTGVLGAFTTYSALALDTAHLGPQPLLAATYCAGTLVTGLLASFVGLAIFRARPAAPPPTSGRGGGH